jgi:hypothetical protein
MDLPGTANPGRSLNTRIYRLFKNDSRDALGVQLPNETLLRGSGTCRGFAVFRGGFHGSAARLTISIARRLARLHGGFCKSHH